MIWVIACCLMALPPPSEEVAQFVEEAGQQIDEEAAAFLKNLYEQVIPESPCKKCLPSQAGVQPTYNLMVFMSFSVPLESWKDWSYALESRGGAFVLRGLPGNSFQILDQKIKELRDAGVHAPIYVDPEVYGKYEVEVVPSIVFVEGAKFRKITGNVRMEKIFDLFLD